jgi:hypothetical protein
MARGIGDIADQINKVYQQAAYIGTSGASGLGGKSGA